MPALTAPEIDRLARSRGSLNAQAAVWSDALRDGNASPGLQAAFERWRAERPEHAAAFDALDHTYRMARLAGGAHAAQAMEAEIAATMKLRTNQGTLRAYKATITSDQ